MLSHLQSNIGNAVALRNPGDTVNSANGPHSVCKFSKAVSGRFELVITLFIQFLEIAAALGPVKAANRCR